MIPIYPLMIPVILWFKKVIVIFGVIITSVIVTACSDIEIAPLDFNAPADDSEINISHKESVTIDRVIDGDTVDIVNKEGVTERVRLLLIDTPESVHPTEPVQAFGPEASMFAKSLLLEGDNVYLERGNPKTDKYDRTLGYLWFVDANKHINFNQVMLEEGLARVAYVFEPNTKYLDEFRQAESDAKSKGLNIWSIKGYATDSGFDMSVIH